MRYFMLILGAFYGFLTHAYEKPSLSDLNSLNWQNRIIIVNTLYPQSQVVQRFKQRVTEIDDRHIVWFVIKNQQVLSNYPGKLSAKLLANIQNRYQVPPGMGVLIGKDGRVKSQFDFVNFDALFLQIDAMPMRQIEMQ